MENRHRLHDHDLNIIMKDQVDELNKTLELKQCKRY